MTIETTSSTTLRHDQLIDNAESGNSQGLWDVVNAYLDQGFSAESLLADFETIRPLVSDEAEDEILATMNLLVGWCSPHQRLWDKQSGNR